MKERLEEYIKNYVDLLHERGYHEERLKNGHKPGTLAGIIREAFTNLVNAPEAKTHKYCTLTADTFGKFNEGKDTLYFRFNFVYNVEKGTISIGSISFGQNLPEAAYLPSHNAGIPRPEEILMEYKEVIQKKLAEEQHRKPAGQKKKGFNGPKP